MGASNPVAAWHAEHVYFQRLLELLRREVDAFHTGAEPNYDLMLDIVSYLRDYSDRCHHPREDVAFACLAKHHPEIALTLARLRQEHRVIAQAGENLRGLLSAAQGGEVVSRADIEVAAATYLVYYGNHIAEEEEDVLALAGKKLSLQDWEAVKSAAPFVRDPLFGDAPAARYRELLRQVTH